MMCCIGLLLAALPANGLSQVRERSQVAMQNNTRSAADLYVDGEYSCRALATLMCVTQVTPGAHRLTAGQYSRDMAVEAGAVYTWVIP